MRSARFRLPSRTDSTEHTVSPCSVGAQATAPMIPIHDSWQRPWCVLWPVANSAGAVTQLALPARTGGLDSFGLSASTLARPEKLGLRHARRPSTQLSISSPVVLAPNRAAAWGLLFPRAKAPSLPDSH
ncbi:hypothetical protein VTN96DRAFT_946 [Rasamsonia emersonii]